MNHYITYDAKYDILRIREVGRGNLDYYSEFQANGNIIEFRDMGTGELKGFEISNLMQYLNTNK